MAIGSIAAAAGRYMANAPTTGIRHPGLSDDLLRSRGSQGASTDSNLFDRIANSFEKVNDAQNNADAVLADLASAERVDLHGMMISMEKAEISLRTMVSVRDKAVAAYESIMNMAI